MIINCNQEMPDTPLAFFECTTEVSNASTTEPLPTPSGIVSFTVNPGARRRLPRLQHVQPETLRTARQLRVLLGQVLAWR